MQRLTDWSLFKTDVFSRLPDDQAAALEQLWRAKAAANPRLFNGTKFRSVADAPQVSTYLGSTNCDIPSKASLAVCRFHSAVVEADGSATIRLGTTDYKHHFGTNLALGDHVPPVPDACLANVLGCAGVVVTADDHLVLLRRSANVPYNW